MGDSNRSRVFLSYAHENLDTVRRIVVGLKKRKLNVWFDKEQLKPGEWMPQIEKAIARSRYFVICVSEAALRKTGDERPGFQDKELNAAYKIAQRQPDTEFTIVPVRLEDCDRGDFRLTSFQQYDLFDYFEKGLDHLAIVLGGFSLADITLQDERTEDEKMIERLIGKASAAYYAGGYENAITILDTVLAIKPNSANAWSNRGSCLEILGYYEEALDAFEKAIDLKPDIFITWYNIGVALIKLGRQQEAMLAFDKAIELRPQLPEAWCDRDNQISELFMSIKDMINEIKDKLNQVGDQPLAKEINNLSEIISRPNFDMKQGLKLSIPIVPFILSYEGVLESGSKTKLTKLWRSFVHKIRPSQ